MTAPHTALYDGPFDPASLAWFEGAALAADSPEDAAEAQDIADLIRSKLKGERGEGSARKTIDQAA